METAKLTNVETITCQDVKKSSKGFVLYKAVNPISNKIKNENNALVKYKRLFQIRLNSTGLI